MCLKPLNAYGGILLVSCTALMTLCSALAFTATWWKVSFWECDSSFESEITHFSLIINEGLCSDRNGKERSDFDNCQSWDNEQDEGTSDVATDEAELYEHARAVCIAALVLTPVLLCVSGVEFKAPEYIYLIRHVQMLGFCAVFLMCTFNIAALSDTWYTNPENYEPYDFCDSRYSGPDIGLYSALLSVVLSLFCGIFLIFPCKIFVDEPERGDSSWDELSRRSENNTLDGGLSTNLLVPIAIPVSPNGRSW